MGRAATAPVVVKVRRVSRARTGSRRGRRRSVNEKRGSNVREKSKRVKKGSGSSVNKKRGPPP